MKAERSLTRQIIAITALSVGLVMLAAAVAASLLLKAHAERSFDSSLREDGQVLIASLSRDKNGTLVVSELPENRHYAEQLSGWYWIVHHDDEVVARSRSLATQTLPRGPSGIGVGSGPRGEPIRTVALEKPMGGGASTLMVTVAGPQSAVSRTVLAEVMQLVAGLGSLGLVLISVLWWQINRSLAPLSALAHDIEQLRDGHIMELSPSRFVELAGLTTTINDLLGQSRRLVAGYRDRTAKLAHSLKTPLALIAARAGASDGPVDDKVLDAVAAMQRQIDHNLKRARAASGSSAFATRVPVSDVAADLMFAMAHAYASRRGLSQGSVSVSHDAVFLGDREDLEEMLGNLIENAHKWARSSVSVSAMVRDERLKIVVEDDGPGFPSELMGDRTAPASAPSNSVDRKFTEYGLGLIVTREIASAYDGTLALENRRPQGAKAVLGFRLVAK
jgi:signal transduction histidine kinase